MHYRLPVMLPLTVIFLLLITSWKVYSYAEIHYTFFRYSLINRRYPELITDAPWRVDPGEPVPIVCIVKDADQFPIKLRRITAKYRMEDGEVGERFLLSEEKALHVSDHYWNMITFLELPPKRTGAMKISVEVEYVKNGIRKKAISDNLPGLLHPPFDVYVSPCKLPAFDGWYCGDPHYHSDMTQDQIEFGAPVEVAAVMGKSMGLSWLAAADHSYDLDRAIGEFFEHDSTLTRWRRVREDASFLNSRNSDFFVIPAEEISCGNSKSHNIHILAFNTSQFIPGSGDGVKRGLNKRPDLTLRQCLSRINNLDGFAYAAHPEEGNGFFGTLLLNRGNWRDQDYAQGGYYGLQFWNGQQGKHFAKSYKKWIQLLLEGRRLYILGGNDAHGDFNRCRKVKYPNTKLSESGDHVFGKIRTYTYCGTDLSLKRIMGALRNGRTVVTDGPVAILQAQSSTGQTAGIGDDIVGREFTVEIKARSSEEFGPIDRINLYRGDLVDRVERIERTFIPQSYEGTGRPSLDCVFTHKIDSKNRGYVRLEATSSARGEQYTCITNPLWFRPV